ncbi:MAG: DUF2249 domain-containing protein [Arcobacteraceae bacterium]
MSKELLLDTRELEAPEPMGLVLKNLHKLDDTFYIKMVHRIEPLMLYVHLEANQLHYKTIKEDEEIIIFIWTDGFTDKTLFEDL